MNFCLNCYEKVGVCNCKDSEYVDVDVNILEIVSVLNKKGYYTIFSCEGHIVESRFISPSISFLSYNNIDPTKIGKYWIARTQNPYVKSKNNSVEYFLSSHDEKKMIKIGGEQKLLDIKNQALHELLIWAIDLPSIRKG